MPRTRNPYPAEFGEQIIALAKAGRSVESLAREFEPCVATIHGWVKQADPAGGRRDGVATIQGRDDFAAFAGRTASIMWAGRRRIPVPIPMRCWRSTFGPLISRSRVVVSLCVLEAAPGS